MDIKRNYKYLLSDISALKGVGIKTTNLLKKKKRNIHFGILSNQDRRLSDCIITEMKRRKLKVGDNEPYEGNLIGDTMYKHGLKNNLHHTLIEVRNDLLSSSTKIHRVSALLKQVINNSINRI